VIDNEPRGSARDLVEGFAACPQVPVHNENETAPAILAARNHASDTADDIDLLVFIDDVERPSEQWLSLLIHTWLTYRCAVVVGPVISGYEVEPDVWVGLAASSTVRPTMS
jgi:succinoglycan biosynthesis protein ExoM